ncbi:MAG: PEP-CTERM sorting domain-containing protein [Crocosphaera sp.]
MKINNYLTKTAIISAVSSLAMFGVADISYGITLNVGNSSLTTGNQNYQLTGVDRTGYSFTAPSYDADLVRIDVLLVNGDGLSAITETVFIDIFENVDGNNFPTGSPLTTLSKSVTLGEVGSGTATSLEQFTAGLPDDLPIDLNPDATYALSVYTASGSSMLLRSSCITPDGQAPCSGSPGYTGIEAPPLQIFGSTNGGTSYFAQSSQRIIDVYVSDDPASTPEPGTVLGLLAMGFVGGVSTLKNKNKG